MHHLVVLVCHEAVLSISQQDMRHFKVSEGERLEDCCCGPLCLENTCIKAVASSHRENAVATLATDHMRSKLPPWRCSDCIQSGGRMRHFFRLCSMTASHSGTLTGKFG